MRLSNAGIGALAVLAMGIAAVGCVPGANGAGGEDNGKGWNAVGTSDCHLTPKSNGLQSFAGTSGGAQLTYYGGPVISTVKIWTVFWGSSVNYQSDLNGFFSTITQSTYFDWLSEYDTPTQNIGRGSLGGSIVDSNPPSGSTIDDSQIQQEIAKLISSGQLPPNDGNNLYMVYFPPGLTITQGGSQSCNQFCAYHGTFTNNGANAYYGVIPDLGGACASGCGNGNQFQNTTSVSSHEMIEAVTDPGVGLATGMSAPLGWYDQTNGEIGDICNAQQTQVAGYTVQLEWSNQQGACVASGPGGTGSGSSGAGTGSGAGGGSSGSGAGSGSSGAGGSGSSGSTSTGSTGSSGTTGGACAHPICASGASLDPSCDPCAAQVCSQDGYCCSTTWDSTCVGEVGSICGQGC